jgi:hypothetical protein
MPSSRPVITLPMTWPLSSSRASVAANGTSTWPTTEPRPTRTAATASTGQLGANAIASRQPQVPISITVSNRRRSSRSPSGTSSARPIA